MTKPTKLTMGELESIEDYADMPLSAMADPTAKKTRLLSALALAFLKRENPAATINDVQAMTEDDVLDVLKRNGYDTDDSGE